MFGLDNVMDMLFDSAMESIGRNERIIKLLKKLNLDPEHPPEDFTGVYQYALVEYGVGKSRPVLEIFRQREIQQLFRKALEQNNPAKLLNQGEAFLAGQSLQTDLQAQNIDVRREFYEFATVFITVAKRTRTPAEILANQKLESLHRQLGRLQERLNRLPTLEGMRTEMARLAGQDLLALPGAAAFSADRCKAFALAQQMRGWFETLGFRFEAHESWQADDFEWIINIPVRRGRYDRILVRGMDGEAGLRDVELLKQSVEIHRTDEGWLVTARRISRAARDQVGKPENACLGCYTLDELLDQDADFSRYLNWLEAEIQQRGIDQTYVPLACTKEEIDPDTRQRLGVSRYGDRDGWIDGYIDLWLDDPAKEHISVLGEFGTGKTWFALHYAWKALQRYREAQRRGLERPRLPLVVPLRDYAKAVSVESLFSEFFFRKHEIPIPGYSAFEQLNRMGKLLLIFDGFDEMAARVDRQQMINNFWELAKVVVPGSKVILTCRTEHFPEAKEGRALLNAELQASTKDLTGETPQFEVLELEKFNDGQIQQVLSHQAKPATVVQIMGNPQLLDLARRPVLTELILEALPDIEAGKPVDMSRVYLYAVRHKMERDIKAERTFTSMADKLYFMCELSWEMLSTDRMSINYREFPDRIRKLFGPVVEEEKDLDHWHYDMMGQTMLVRNAEGDYTPAHRSLLEFFVAYKFAAELGAIKSDYINCIHASSKKGDKAGNYTWSSYLEFAGHKNKKQGQLEAIKIFDQEPLEKLSLSFGISSLTKAIEDLIILIVRQDEVGKNALVKAVKATQRKDEKQAMYVGGNAIRIIIKTQPSLLSEMDLSYAFIKGVDLSKSILIGTKLSNASLVDCIFRKYFSVPLSITFSPDGTLILTGHQSGEIRAWSSKTGEHQFSLKGHHDWVWSLFFDESSNNLISASSDQTAKAWNLNNRHCLKTFEHGGRVNTAVTCPELGILITGSDDCLIRVWDVKSGDILKLIKGHTKRIRAIVYSAKNKIIASGSSDCTLRLWEIDTGKCLKTIISAGAVNTLSLSPCQEIIASGNDGNKICILNIKTGEIIENIEGHSSFIESIDFSSDGNFLISGSNNGELKAWSAESGENIFSLKAHMSKVTSVSISPDSSLVASGSHDNSIKIWDQITRKCVKNILGFDDWIGKICFSSDGDYLVGGGKDSVIRLWKANTGQQVRSFLGHDSWIWSVKLSPANNLLVSSSHDRTIRVWEVSTGKCLKVIRDDIGWESDAKFSSCGNFIVCGKLNGEIGVWSVASGQNVGTISGHTESVRALEFSPCGSYFASVSNDCQARVWDFAKRKCLKVLDGHSDWVRTIQFSPDGKTLISGSEDFYIRFWEISSGRCFKSFQAHKGRVRSIAVSPSGLIFASGGEDCMIKIWDLKSGRFVRNLIGHSGWIQSLAFSPDGRNLVSGGRNGEIQFWNLFPDKIHMVLRPERPYEGMRIDGIKGLTTFQKETLKSLGAIEG